MDNMLYVVFHGLVSLIEDSSQNRFHALLLGMDGHRVAAGHWLTERTIPQGARMELTGVEAGSASLDQTQNVVVTTNQLDTTALSQFLYAEIVLPKPMRALSFSGVDVSSKLQGNSVSAVSSKVFSATQVFEYKLTVPNATLASQLTSPGADFSFTALSGIALPNSTISVTTIHVVNEPEQDVDDAHILEEFRRSALILNSDLSMNAPVLFPSPAGPLPPGLLKGELLPLSQREVNVFDLIGGVRTGTLIGLSSSIGGNKVCGPLQGVVS